MSPRSDRPLRVVGYLRVSTERQLEGLGLDEQERAIRAWCRQTGHRLVTVYRDEAVTGKLAERDGWADADTAIRSGAASGVVVARLDRLARDVMVQETMIADIWRQGGEVFSTAEGEANLRDDPEEPSRKFIRRMMGIVNEYDRDMIVLRMQRGRKLKASRGGFAYGSPPFGYRSVNKRLVPDPAEQATLRRILALAEDGHSTRSIAALLNVEGRTTKRGKPWTSPGVSDVLARSTSEVAA